MKSDKSVPLGLVGRHFHTLGERGEVHEQGCVIAQIDPTHYLVQLYEWFAGTPTGQKIYSIDQMTRGAKPREFQFYDNGEDRAGWYEAFGKDRTEEEAVESLRNP